MYSVRMPTDDFYTFTLPPNAWSKKPYPSTFKMTMDEAARRFPGAQPIQGSREVRTRATTGVTAAKDELYGRKHGPG
ncbi:hypothetical protein [Variovorax sp. PAMC 28711]|uniref:hypothetical protein n=1 Tax=Variovorax sp. PAMC 28711 TaxID=1795631 RepID=UPI00078D27BA|nr:hypothetical protein [Variovorax sp. PAMC 28711]AMM23151.1 hypothetical protein AX767_01270 [Variovorax sp. PAMC 28711]